MVFQGYSALPVVGLGLGFLGALLKFAPDLDLGIVALIVTTVAVITPLVLNEAVKDTRLRFLFRRPDWARLTPAPLPAAQRGPRRGSPALTLSNP